MRGLRPTCALCGALRSPVEAVRAVNVAGRPARFGGRLSGVLGWIMRFGGLFVALLVGGLAQAILPAGIVGYVLGVPIALLTTALAVALLFGGRRLRKSGENHTRATQMAAIFDLARAKGGELEAADVGRAIDLSEAEADALLTELAKRPDGKVELDVDDDGRLRYRFPALRQATRARIVDVPAAKPGDVIDAELVEDEVVPPRARSYVR